MAGMPPFVAIDFETADRGPDSACSVGLVRVEGGRVVRTEARLIRTPRQIFTFTYVHGIRWRDVQDQPTFGELWPTLTPLLDGAAFLVAHNSGFDKGVLTACCERAGLPVPELPFACTVRMARKAWALRPANLPSCCRHLSIPLKHHDAASDAEACARIAIAALSGPRGPTLLPRGVRFEEPTPVLTPDLPWPADG